MRVQVVVLVVPRGSTSSLCVEESEKGSRVKRVAFVQGGEGCGSVSSHVSRPLNGLRCSVYQYRQATRKGCEPSSGAVEGEKRNAPGFFLTEIR